MRLVLLLVLVVGCGDADVQPFGGGGYLVRGTGGAAGVSGSAGVGGAAGVPGTGGVPATGGDAGTAGTPGSGGVLGTGGASAPVCASGKYWSDGDPNDGMHRPGSVCGSCHSTFTLSGTVYAKPNEPMGCFGVDGPANRNFIQVTMTNHNGGSVRVNAAGNFWTTDPIVFPVTVGVSWTNGGIYMKATVSRGDCNTCHAPADAGRILPP